MSEEELESSVDEQEDLGRWADLFGLERPAEPEDPEPKKRRGFLSRMRESLAKPRQGLAPQLASMFSDRPVGPNDWDDLEEALISADCGLDTTDEIVNFLRAEAGADSPSIRLHLPLTWHLTNHGRDAQAWAEQSAPARL